MMDRVIRGLPFVFCYLDDLRIASQSPQEQITHLYILFQCLCEFGLVINLEKCTFNESEIEFLGHTVSSRGALPLQSNMEAVQKFPEPTTIKEMQVFLDMGNFYRLFIPNAAHTLLPLTDCLKGSKPASSPVSWSPAMSHAFMEANAALISSMWLQHPDPAAKLALHVDASRSHVGAVLQQQAADSAEWAPLGFFSKKLSSAQVSGVYLTRSCGPVLPEYGTSGSFWKADVLPSSRITSLLHMLCLAPLMPGQPSSVATCPMWQNSHLTSSMCQVCRTWWLTLFPGPVLLLHPVGP